MSLQNNVDHTIPVLTEIISSENLMEPGFKARTSFAESTPGMAPPSPAWEPSTSSAPADMPPPVASSMFVASIPGHAAIRSLETAAMIMPAAPATTRSATSTPSTSAEHSEEWEQLEKNLHENVLKHILTRVDFVLEHRVRDSLADALQGAVENLTAEIRQGLHASLNDVIKRAVNQEISKIQSTRF